MRSRVLVVGLEAGVQASIDPFLAARGFDVVLAATLEPAIQTLQLRPCDIAIVAIELPDLESSIETLRRIDERLQVIVLATGGNIKTVRHGVLVVATPLDWLPLDPVIGRLLEAQRSRRRAMAINVVEHRRGVDPFLGSSAAIQALAEQAHRVLDSHAPILVQGETGTGKGVIASWLHHHGPRAEEAFVDINCAGLSREFVESELFGHERGAFTGASVAKLGLLDVAHRGTAFLDEIGEIDLQLQPRLLKVLEDKRFRRLGDVRDHVVDIRLIAATNRDLARRAREGTFRSDLYYRINTVSLFVPPLRARTDDIPILARQIANSLGHDIDFTADALRAMVAYEWPGNVRELRNVIERAVLLSNRSPRITTNDLRFEAYGAATPDPEDLVTLEEAERRHIERVLSYENGSVERAAVRLGVSRSTLYQKLRRIRQQHTKPDP